MAVAAAQQAPDKPVWASSTIREALSRSGFDDAILASNPPDLDRTLTSSTFGTTERDFVGAFYFDDEIDDGGLGPLHVSGFDPESRRWTHAPLYRGDDRGSAMHVQTYGSRLLVVMHASPSASHTLVLDSRTLRPLTTVYGGGVAVMPEGSILYVSSLVHFAPTHQSRLMLLSATDGRIIELFPGSHRSAVAAAYRQKVRTAYARVPEFGRPMYEQSGYGPIDDFDRSFSTITQRGGTRIAFVTVYSCARCGADLPVPEERTVVVCDANARPEGRWVRTWMCDERPLDSAARELGVTVQRNSEGRYDQHAFDALVGALLKRR